jgi:hypothetical protein
MLRALASLTRSRAAAPTRHPCIHAVLPSAGDGAGQGAPLRGQLYAGVTKPPAVAPRLLMHVGLGLRRLAPLAEWMQVAHVVGAAVDDGLDVIAGSPTR